MYRGLLILMSILVFCIGSCFAQDVPMNKLPEKQATEVKQIDLLLHSHTSECGMTSAEPVQIVCILDRSGSMRHLVGDTIGGYNSFLDKQRQEKGSAEVTTVLFDDKYEKLVEAQDIKKVPELTDKEYYARGMTALLDAVGRTVTDTFGRMNHDGICPAKRRVLFLIMTDGKENDSREYTKADVKAMIEKATNEYKWNFIFMGANMDSVSEAASIGISADHAVNFAHDSAGVRQSFALMNEAAKAMREEGNVGDNWKNADE